MGISSGEAGRERVGDEEGLYKWTRDERTEQVQELGKGETWAGPKGGGALGEGHEARCWESGHGVRGRREKPGLGSP